MTEFLASLPLPYWFIGYAAGMVSGIILVILHDLFVIRPTRLRDISHYYVDRPRYRDRGDIDIGDR